MKVLIACEESQVITNTLRKIGIDAYSCDLKPCSGGSPQWHIQGDVRTVLSEQWDAIIAHPTCRYLALSGVRWLYNSDGTKNTERWQHLKEAIEFFNVFRRHPCKLKAIENPIPHCHAVKGFDGIEGIGMYSQTIQPYEFGHTTSKRTALWLEGFPVLLPTYMVPKHMRTYEIHTAAPGPEREALRSKTFQGIASAIAEQWFTKY